MNFDGSITTVYFSYDMGVVDHNPVDKGIVVHSCIAITITRVDDHPLCNRTCKT